MDAIQLTIGVIVFGLAVVVPGAVAIFVLAAPESSASRGDDGSQRRD